MADAGPAQGHRQKWIDNEAGVEEFRKRKAPGPYRWIGEGVELAPNATSESKHDEALSIPGGVAQPGDKLVVEALVEVTGVNATDEVVLKAKLAGVTLLTTASTNPTVGDALRCLITVDLVTLTKMHFTGISMGDIDGGGVGIDQAIDFAVSQDLEITATWNAANAANKTRVRLLRATFERHEE